MGDIRGFLKFSREEPSRRKVQDRIQDWREFYQPFSSDRIQKQAARCMDCGVPFCQSNSGCPVENRIPDWNDLVHRGKWKEAIESLHSTNNFPEFTGRLCPAPCESACVLGIHDDSVAIRVIEWNIIDYAFEKGWVVPLLPSHRTSKKVAIVGSGPAGLAAAQELARMGHEVTVFEKNAKIGGLLRYGIPDFKLEKGVIDRRLDQMAQEGVKFLTGINVGEDVTLHELMNEYHAVCLTLGAEEPRDLQVPGRELSGIYFAMDYLSKQNIAISTGLPNSIPEEMSAKNKNVIVIGGGDTGSDCIGTAHRQGCRTVTQLEILSQPPLDRSTETPWPNWPFKLRSSHAHEEGGLREWNIATTEFMGSKGRVEKLRTRKITVEGNQNQFGSDIPVDFDTDLIILAMGFVGVRRKGFSEITYTEKGQISTQPNFMTNIPGVFAAGDARRGASLIVWAISEGRKMAKAVDQYLTKGVEVNL